MRSTNCVLELVNVSKSFNNDFEVIKDISFKVKKGEFVCLIGPSGCGKTVLLYTIAGLLSPTSGKISKNGQEINLIGPDRIMVFQDHMLFPWKSVIENVLFGLINFKISQSEKIIKAEKYLEMVGLSNFKNWPIHKLSGGMKQRVAFARALVADPEILLMDEPFSALDSISRRHLRKNLIEIWQKTKQTILFVTHSMDEAIYLADTIYVMSSRPTTILKSYSVTLPRPRNASNHVFVKLLKKLDHVIETEFNLDLNTSLSQASINKLIINNL